MGEEVGKADDSGAEMPLVESLQWGAIRVLYKGRSPVRLAVEEISLTTRNGGVGWSEVGEGWEPGGKVEECHQFLQMPGCRKAYVGSAWGIL